MEYFHLYTDAIRGMGFFTRMQNIESDVIVTVFPIPRAVSVHVTSSLYSTRLSIKKTKVQKFFFG